MKNNLRPWLERSMLTLFGVVSVSAILYGLLPSDQHSGAPNDPPESAQAALPAPSPSAPLVNNASDEVNVAWFLEWATPNQLAKIDKRFDEVMGVEVNWINFGSGAEMSKAMQAGEIDIAYSQGLAPFATAVNEGVPITMIGIAMAYGSNDDCIIRDDARIGNSQSANLEGQTVAVSLNTMADFGFRMTMDALGVDTEKVKVLDQESSVAAESLVRGDVVMACGFGGQSLAKMKTVGNSILTAEEKIEAGITSFDIVSVRNDFLKNSPEHVRSFLAVTHEANRTFIEDPSRINELAMDAGLSVESAREQQAGFQFPDVEQQRNKYFGENGLLLDMLGFMGHLFATEEMPALDDYRVVIDSSYL